MKKTLIFFSLIFMFVTLNHLLANTECKGTPFGDEDFFTSPTDESKLPLGDLENILTRLQKENTQEKTSRIPANINGVNSIFTQGSNGKGTPLKGSL